MMKVVTCVLFLIIFFKLVSCQRDHEDTKDFHIDRQEEIERDRFIERKNLENPNNHDFELDRNVLDIEEFKHDE